VGPRSAGSEPGPVAYGRGGIEPTVTDANAALGRFPPMGLLGGAMSLDTAAAQRAILDKVAAPLSLTPEVAASGIIKLAVVTMSAAVRRISIERGHDPRDFVLVVSGGAGPLHAAAIARELSIPTVLVPPLPGHFSAWGMLLADIRFDYAQTFVSLLDAADSGDLEEKYRAMEAEAEAALKRTAPNLQKIECSRFAEMRYAGQEHTVRVLIPASLAGQATRGQIQANFVEAYSQRYGHTDAKGRLEFVTLRVVGDGIVDKPDLSSFAPKAVTPGEPLRGHKAYFDDTGWVDCPVYRRETLMAGQEIAGPAIVSETGSTSVIPPGDEATVDRLGNIVIRIASRFQDLSEPPARLS
jgi:N-methylhydantoinase A